MGKFSSAGGREMPELNKSSLPDLVFAFLFFIMMVTSMREVTLKVVFKAPQATELQKLEKKSLVSYIYVGVPVPKFAKTYGTEPRIQLNDQFAFPSEISAFIEKERAARSESDREFLTTSLKVDTAVVMGIVTDVKQELRKVGAYKINYSTKKGKKK